jgi:hypothetical protein
MIGDQHRPPAVFAMRDQRVADSSDKAHMLSESSVAWPSFDHVDLLEVPGAQSHVRLVHH